VNKVFQRILKKYIIDNHNFIKKTTKKKDNKFASYLIFSLSLCPLSPERLKWVRDGGGVRESN
jgi:hypothetical protein